MSRQSRMTAFFGAASSSKDQTNKKGLKQTKITFFNNDKARIDTSEKSTEKDEVNKNDLVDTSEDEEEQKKEKAIIKNRRSDSSVETKALKRRRVIEDDDSDEEDQTLEELKQTKEKEDNKVEAPTEIGANDKKDNNEVKVETEEANISEAEDIEDAEEYKNEEDHSETDDDDEEEEEVDDEEDITDLKKPVHEVKKKNEKIVKQTKAPSKQKVYSSDDKNEVKKVDWKEVPYSALCDTFAEIEAITSRLQIQKLLTDLFRQILQANKEDLLQVIYLASNSVAPAYQCVELGVGDSLLIKAISEASGSNRVKKQYESLGDLGTTAEEFKAKVRTLGFGIQPKPLTCNNVLKTFRQIATTTGKQSQKWKVDQIKQLLVRAKTGKEAKYIIRGLQGKLRIGLAQSTVLISLAHALALSPPVEGKEEQIQTNSLPPEETRYYNKKLPIEQRLDAAANIIKKAYSEVPSYDALIESCLQFSLIQLHKKCTLKPGIPVAPMLAKPTKSIQEILQRLSNQRFTCEFKYDGERAQIHFSEKGCKVFSRNLLDTTEKFPEVPQYVSDAHTKDEVVTSYIMDAEVVAYNRETQQFVPFQILSTRAKKTTEKDREEAKVKVIVQAFDLMFLNGESLLNHTLAQRRELLQKHFRPVDGRFQFAKFLDHKENGDTTVLEEFLDTAVKGQCEGLMVKTLDDNAAYEPSRRSMNWLKLKKDYLEGLGDSVDLVPLGAYYGRGKRTGVYGAYLLGCYDLDSEEFQSVCKIGTGFSDADLKDLAEGLKPHIIPKKSSQYNVSDVLECDVWFEAVQVWEIKAADLSKSSTHRGAVDKTGETGRGIGLRFPRYERLRVDKQPEEATTSDQILDMYYAQDSIVNDGMNAMNDDGGL